jgi:hypothetical protein
MIVGEGARDADGRIDPIGVRRSHQSLPPRAADADGVRELLREGTRHLLLRAG